MKWGLYKRMYHKQLPQLSWDTSTITGWKSWLQKGSLCGYTVQMEIHCTVHMREQKNNLILHTWIWELDYRASELRHSFLVTGKHKLAEPCWIQIHWVRQNVIKKMKQAWETWTGLCICERMCLTVGNMTKDKASNGFQNCQECVLCCSSTKQSEWNSFIIHDTE